MVNSFTSSWFHYAKHRTDLMARKKLLNNFTQTGEKNFFHLTLTTSRVCSMWKAISASELWTLNHLRFWSRNWIIISTPKSLVDLSQPRLQRFHCHFIVVAFRKKGFAWHKKKKKKNRAHPSQFLDKWFSCNNSEACSSFMSFYMIMH